ncbi:trypsin-like peptidase domain-containing protein [Methylobacterium mesophilicum SR1.6/6]|uniref:Trypsin-like peptidase domain-containing protein n=1 Tax=Methylobacterium mesophilicum SR1.6/6 TaxID=908290 RepID=A0A6B9FP69_9HYPH|nr:serine protease [Methylobacterium mesophilicum]QGY04411.1 trypsin-like peptidase domain-containing protein [Methylobacterium mesophilicum SR1.6/6]
MVSGDASRCRIPGAPRGRARRATALAILIALGTGAVAAQDRPAPARAAPGSVPAVGAPVDPAFEAMKAGFEALPEADRKALQDALVWTGAFNAVVSGAFGRRTYEALTAYAARTGGADPLDPRERAALLAAGAAARNAARFRVAVDPGTGAVMGVPERLLAKRTALPSGTRWQSQDGRVTLESRAFPPGAESLDALFEKATAPLPGRKVTYKLRRPDTVVVTAETGPGLSYIRYAIGPEGVRGFLLGYDRALAPEVDRLVIAVANAFVPFPDPAAAPAAQLPSGPAPETRVPNPVPQPQAAAPLRPASLASAPASGAGLAVAPGRVLTATAVLENCVQPRVGATPARVLATDPAGLTLLDVPGAPAPLRPAIRSETVGGEESVIALAPGSDGVQAAPGDARGGDVIAALQPGSSGAPVLDRSGALVGIVARYPAAPRRVAGVVPPARLPVVPARAITAFLATQGIAGAAPRPGGGPGAVAPAVVGITCR